MNGDPPSPHWFFKKWPDGLKIAAAIGTICGTTMGLVSVGTWLSGSLKSYKSAVVARAAADKEVIDRNKKIDEVLTFHGQQNWTAEKKMEEMDKKLDKIIAQTKK